MTRGALVVVTAAACLLSGCTHSSMAITASEASFPISFSQGFFDGSRLILSESYEVVHHFRMEYESRTLNRFAETRRIDVSEDLRALVGEHEGEAIVNLSVKAYDSTWTNCAGPPFCVITAGLVCPGFVGAIFEGDIVRTTQE